MILDFADDRLLIAIENTFFVKAMIWLLNTQAQIKHVWCDIRNPTPLPGYKYVHKQTSWPFGVYQSNINKMLPRASAQVALVIHLPNPIS